jgi:hypothetical protein
MRPGRRWKLDEVPWGPVKPQKFVNVFKVTGVKILTCVLLIYHLTLLKAGEG